MKYKIGEVSKFLNIPMETLRHYEKRNIVKPEKDEENNYRYYNAWDMNFIGECKRYLGFGYSLSEIEEILHHDDLANFISRMKIKQVEFENQLKYFQCLVQKQANYVNSLEKIKTDLNKCILKKRPEAYYFIHRYNYEYISKENLGGIFEVWHKYYPFVDIVSALKKETLLERNRTKDYQWGYSLEKEYIEAFDIPINDKVIHLKQEECVYTVVAAGGQGTYSPMLLDQAMRYIETNHYELNGDAVGNLLTRLNEPNGYKRYLEFYIPVKKISKIK